MENKGAEYTVRDFSAVDTQVAEMAKREQLLTWRLRIENLKRLGMPLIYFAAALAIVIIALGIFFWLIQKERVVEVDKVVEVIKEVPIISEKLKVIEVPVYIEKPPAKETSSKANIQISDSLGFSKLEKEAGSSGCANNLSYTGPCVDTYQYSDGTVYNGTWNNGYPEGNGKLTFKNGVSIDGTWKQGKLEKISSEMEPRSQSKQSKSIGLNLPQVKREVSSSSCAKNSSHKVQCSDTYKYENGFEYVGSWYRGYPHGKGTVKFQDGSSVQGFWETGRLQRVINEMAGEIKALKKSVTIFTKVPGKDINPSFGDITVGHNFKSGAAEIWDFAYCYVNIIDDAESIRIDLSLRSSYDINSRPSLEKYKFNKRYSSSDFTKAQNACSYQWSGFN